MDRLRWRQPAPQAAPGTSGIETSDIVEGAAPGVAALLGSIRPDRSHAVLDLGAASDHSLHVYGAFARWVRFVDLFGGGWQTAPGATLVQALPLQPERPYDLVFAWDVLDRLSASERSRLVQRLFELTAPGARLHVVARAADHAPARPLRFALLDIDRMRFEPTGEAPLPRAGLLPAQVNALLAPFQVQHAFTLKTGLREYVALRSAH